ncbi:MAG: PP2C family serine/threonine-protein phosphatase [Myxococcota bacterium]
MTTVVVGQDTDPPLHKSFVSGEAIVFSTPRPEGTGVNQDAVDLFERTHTAGVIAVADGVGGAAHGAKASHAAISAVRKKLRGASDAQSMRTAILNGIEYANRQVKIIGSGAATTIAVLQINGARVRPYHVGDSGVLIVSQRGSLKYNTIDHGPVGYALEAGILDEHEAMHHQERHVISNYVGSDAMRIELGATLTLGVRDTALLATDGLFDNLFLSEIVEIIRKGPLMEAAENLITQSRNRMHHESPKEPGKPDDLTFVLYRRRQHLRPVA